MPSTMWLIDAFTISAVSAGTSATLSAIVARRGGELGARARPGSRARSARPRSAENVSAQNRNSFALRGPSSHGSTSSSTPTPDMRSTGFEKRASSAATIRSHMHASISPAAEHVPCTAAIVTLRKSRMRTSLSKYMVCSCASLPSGVSRIAAQCSSPASSSFRSWPAEKCLPSAASTTTRTSSSASARSNAASSSSISRLFCALAASGRASVIVAIGPSTS